MLAAVAGERLPPPAAPPLAQSHPGELRHQVELRGPGVPERDRVALELPVDHPEVMGDKALSCDVELVEPPARLAHVEREDRLAGRELPQARDADLDHEA